MCFKLRANPTNNQIQPHHLGLGLEEITRVHCEKELEEKVPHVGRKQIYKGETKLAAGTPSGGAKLSGGGGAREGRMGWKNCSFE
jgi:hypothetical protein